MNSYSDFIQNCQRLNAPKYPSQDYIPPSKCGTSINGILFSNKKKTIKQWKLLHIALMKEVSLKSYILFMINYIISWEKPNYTDSKMNSSCQRFGAKMGKMNMWIREILRQWNYFVWYCNDDIWHYVFVKINCTTQRVNLNINYGLYLIIIYQYWLINKYTTLMKDFNKKHLHYINCSTFCKHKTALRKSLLIFKNLMSNQTKYY